MIISHTQNILIVSLLIIEAIHFVSNVQSESIDWHLSLFDLIDNFHNDQNDRTEFSDSTQNLLRENKLLLKQTPFLSPIRRRNLSIEQGSYRKLRSVSSESDLSRHHWSNQRLGLTPVPSIQQQSIRSQYDSDHHANRHPNSFAQLAHQYSPLKLHWLSNVSVTCNDGTRAGFYIRTTTSRRWLIFLEGGWYCMSKNSCDQRWYKMRDFMTSFRWSPYRTFNGILSSSSTVNPFWWDANHVFIPYCSSDIWSGDYKAPPTEMSFLGSRILDEVIGELIRFPSYRFMESKFILLAGSSAGAAGVMINLDRISRMISDAGCNANVAGLADSGWILDNFQNLKIKTHRCSRSDKNCQSDDNIAGAFKMWKSRVPQACAEIHSEEPWRCFFGYRIHQTLRSPLFVVQFQYDEFQIYMDGLSSIASNEMDRLRYVRYLPNQIIATLSNVSAVFAPSCIAHILLTKIDWHKVTVRGINLPEALNCWEQSLSNGGNLNSFFHPHIHHHRIQKHENYNHRSFTFYDKQARHSRAISSKNFEKNSEETIDSKTNIKSLDDNSTNSHITDEEKIDELAQFYSPSSSSYRISSWPNMDRRTRPTDSLFETASTKQNSSGAIVAENNQAIIAQNGNSLGWNDLNTNRELISDKSNRKKKKRKRRKGFPTRKNTDLTENESENRRRQSNNLNMPNPTNFQYETSADYDHSRYFNHNPSASRRHHRKNTPMMNDWIERNPSIQQCRFRLIDHHQYPEQNNQCPSFQFDHNDDEKTLSDLFK